MSFDRVANYYAWMEKIVFGNDLENIRNVPVSYTHLTLPTSDLV